MSQMKKGAGATILVIIIACMVGLCTLMASVLLKDGINGFNEDANLRLGLDLAGGVSITYEVDGDTPTPEQLSDTVFKLQQRIENDLSAKSATTEASVYPVGDRRISVEIPGVTDANAILEELGNPGQLYFISHRDPSGNETYDEASQTLNYDLNTLIENGSVIATGSNVISARAGYNTNPTTGAQDPVVDLQFDGEASEAFANATAQAVANGNDSIGIYYDGEFISIPTVNSEITGGQCYIEGIGSYEDAESLASYIRIGGLDVTLKELQSEVVGAQLGSNALSTSLLAGAIGLGIVIAFLLVFYMIPGLAASMALIIYTTLLVLLIQAFDITLTLPGIAGIILTIGMAVDANVIIFARIREEIANGKSVKAAVELGYKKALGAILDGNITTLIAAIVLGVIGSGSVRGFAITLAMGVIISMFTALFVTKLILSCFVALGATKEGAYTRGFKTPRINFVKRKPVYFIISLAIVVAGIVAMGVNGGSGRNALEFSQEFLGGTSTTVDLGKNYSIEELEEKLVPVVSDVTGDNDIQVQKVQGQTSVVIKTRALELNEREALDNAITGSFDVDSDSISSESIGSTISGEMRSQSIIAIIVAVICMLIYIWIRFRDLRFASSAVICLAHDVMIVITFYAFARITVGSAFIACMLTVIGYSINATIVTFDRVRENIKNGIKDKEALKEIANTSINQTLTRSIATSLTTAFTVIMLLILGVPTIRDFALPLLIGIIAGTWSSVCIATTLWYVFRAHIGKKLEDKPERPKSDKHKTVKATKENQGIIV